MEMIFWVLVFFCRRYFVPSLKCPCSTFLSPMPMENNLTILYGVVFWKHKLVKYSTIIRELNYALVTFKKWSYQWIKSSTISLGSCGETVKIWMRVELQLHLTTQVTYFLSVVHFSIIQMIILNFSRTEVRIRERLYLYEMLLVTYLYQMYYLWPPGTWDGVLLSSWVNFTLPLKVVHWKAKLNDPLNGWTVS